MKRLAAALLACLTLLSATSAAAKSPTVKATPTAQTGVTINVYNWGEYISTGKPTARWTSTASLPKLTGIKVNYTTFEDNESMYSKIAGGGAKLRRDYPVGLYDIEDDKASIFVQKLDFEQYSELQIYRQRPTAARPTTRTTNIPFRTRGAS
jgi:spermidine/putrescine transport system substrate-binding protein